MPRDIRTLKTYSAAARVCKIECLESSMTQRPAIMVACCWRMMMIAMIRVVVSIILVKQYYLRTYDPNGQEGQWSLWRMDRRMVRYSY